MRKHRPVAGRTEKLNNQLGPKNRCHCEKVPEGRMRGDLFAKARTAAPHLAFGHPLPEGEGSNAPFSHCEKVPEGRMRGDLFAKARAAALHLAFGHPLLEGEGSSAPFSHCEKVPEGRMRGDLFAKARAAALHLAFGHPLPEGEGSNAPFSHCQRFLGVGLLDLTGSGSRFESRRAMGPAGRPSRPAAWPVGSRNAPSVCLPQERCSR